jgi:hypothetical protein
VGRALGAVVLGVVVTVSPGAVTVLVTVRPGCVTVGPGAVTVEFGVVTVEVTGGVVCVVVWVVVTVGVEDAVDVMVEVVDVLDDDVEVVGVLLVVQPYLHVGVDDVVQPTAAGADAITAAATPPKPARATARPAIAFFIVLLCSGGLQRRAGSSVSSAV